MEYRRRGKVIKKTELNLPTNAEVNQFLMLRELVTGLYEEMKDLTKKSSKETLNEFKIKSLNRVLKPLRELLKDQPTAMFLDLLEDDSLPTNSDVVIVLSQYLSAMKKYEERYYRVTPGTYTKRWNTKENPMVNNKE